jgi:hypothetical protein
MNYRKYRYLRLDGSSTIMDRRDMVRDFQLRLLFSLLCDVCFEENPFLVNFSFLKVSS